MSIPPLAGSPGPAGPPTPAGLRELGQPLEDPTNTLAEERLDLST